MITLPVIDGVVQGIVPADAVYTVLTADALTVYQRGDSIPPIATNPDPDAALRAQYEAEQAAKEQAEFDQFKARSGAPTYKAAAVHIAAEKLGVLTAIEAAIDALINRAGDKSLYVWWEQIDTISRADAEWQQIEAEVGWEKLGVTPEELFELAAQV